MASSVGVPHTQLSKHVPQPWPLVPGSWPLTPSSLQVLCTRWAGGGEGAPNSSAGASRAPGEGSDKREGSLQGPHGPGRRTWC